MQRDTTKSESLQSEIARLRDLVYTATGQTWREVAEQRLIALNAERERLRVAREALEGSRCFCKEKPILKCPTCGGDLREVRYSGGPLYEKWAWMRAGDYYCVECLSSKAPTGYEYFWDREISHIKTTCQRCAALAATKGE